ncbi:MAG: hypothetical protein HFE77_04110 [Clostridiales bacterium]|nr:hypothetical protein [Clostridiales bacterium]
MLYCEACKVKIAGIHAHCPLCGGNITGEPQEKACYPVLAPCKPNFTKKLMQISAITALAAQIICTAVNVLVTPEIWWCLYTLFGLLCGWVWFAIGLSKKANMKKSIAWQLVVVSVFSLLWDVGTGWRGWSVDFVFPCMYTCALLVLLFLAHFLHVPIRDYIIYAGLGAILGIIPVVFMAVGLAHVLIPSVICVSVSLLVICMLLLFHWKAVHGEVTKKLHL